MQVEQILHQGNLEDALVQLQNQVRKEPANPKLRVFLFQLLAVLGRWERALNQLNVAGELDSVNLLMAQTYREAIQCEVLRGDVFDGIRTPLIFGDPPQWMALLIEALRLDAQGHLQQAKALRDQAFESAPTITGVCNDTAFAWIADADSRLGPVLESIVNGRYYWIPFLQIRKIEIEKPTDLRDVVWMPAQFTWSNGGSSSGLIPTRYPGTEKTADGMLQLARKTEWEEYFKDTYRGLGQRILATDSQEYSLMDTLEIEISGQE